LAIQQETTRNSEDIGEVAATITMLASVPVAIVASDYKAASDYASTIIISQSSFSDVTNAESVISSGTFFGAFLEDIMPRQAPGCEEGASLIVGGARGGALMAF